MSTDTERPAHEDVIVVRPGLRLRAWSVDDRAALLRHADDADVARRVSDRFPHPYRGADADAFLAGEVVDLANAFAIELDGSAVGGIGLRPMAGERAVGAEFGYWLGRMHWGQGLMSAAVAAYVPWALDRHRLARLQATVLDFNEGSARVLQKNGFREEGVMRSAVRKHGRLHDLRLFARLSGTP